MRVIRTEMYFDPAYVKNDTPIKEYPGIGVAWFGAEGGIGEQDIGELLKYKIANFEDGFKIFPIFADLAVRGIKGEQAETALKYMKWEVQNPGIVKFALQSEIVYEASPVRKRPLKEFLEKSVTGLVAGIPLGYLVHEGTDWPLLITIPSSILAVGLAANASRASGIIMIGAANGISEGLKNGLSKRVEDWFKRSGKGAAEKKGKD